MAALQIPVKASRLWLYAGGMGLLLLVSVVIMFNLERIMMAELRIGVMVVAFLGCVVTGYAMLYYGMRAQQAPPVVVADGEGIHFDVSLVNRGHVGWENVRDYALVRHGGQTLALVYLKDPYALIDGEKGLRKRFFKSQLKRYQTPVAIPEGLIAGDAVAVLRGLSEYGQV